MSEVFLAGGRVVDETGERTADVRVLDGVIAEVAAGLAPSAGAPVLDATGCVVAPGLVDIQVHFREPGREEARRSSGCASGGPRRLYGGRVHAQHRTAARRCRGRAVGAGARAARRLRVHVAGCITKGRRGEQLAPMGELYDLGVRMFTDDGDCVADARVMRGASSISPRCPTRCSHSMRRIPPSYAAVTCTRASGRRGSAFPGAPPLPSRRSSPATSRSPSSPAAAITCSTCRAGRRSSWCERQRPRAFASPRSAPRSISCSRTLCAGFDPVFKINPPLREQPDIDARRVGLIDGTIDAIATDHAPHTPETKAAAFEEAPPGMLGVETALAVVLTTLVEPGVLTLADALGALSWRPARVSGLAATATVGRSRSAAPRTSA